MGLFSVYRYSNLAIVTECMNLTSLKSNYVQI